MVAFKSTIATSLATALTLLATPVVADTCHAVGWVYNGDFAVSGGIHINKLYLYNGAGDKIGEYSGGYAPNCCIGEDRSSGIESSLPYVFIYTANMDNSGTAIDGCTGAYADQTGLVGDVDSSYGNQLVGSDVSSSCTIAFDC